MKLEQSIGLVVFLIALAVLWEIRHVLLLGFTAVVLAIALNRGVRWLQQRGLHREFAVIVTIVVTAIAVAALFGIIETPFSQEFKLLVERAPQGIERLRVEVPWLQNFIPKEFATENLNIAKLQQHLPALASSWYGRLFTIFSGSLVIALDGLLVVFLTIMMLFHPVAYRQACVQVFPSFYRRRADDILSRCEIALGNWLVGMLITVSIMTVATAIGLWVLQVPFVLANASLAGILSFIPNIGPTLSVVPPIAVALLDSPWKAISVLVLYIVLHELGSSILMPWIMAKQVSLLPAFTLLAQVAFTIVFGFLGLLLAVPLLVVLQVWLQECLVKDVLDNWQKKMDKADDKITTQLDTDELVTKNPD